MFRGVSWLKGSAFLIFLAAIILFATVLVARFSHARLTSYFLITVLAGLCFAIALHARYLNPLAQGQSENGQHSRYYWA